MSRACRFHRQSTCVLEAMPASNRKGGCGPWESLHARRQKRWKLGKKKGPGGLEMLRLYRPPRTGALLLACGKCQRKLLEDGRGQQLQILTGAMDSCAAQTTTPLRVLEAGCMKECPKDGITLCALRAGEFSLPQPVAVHNARQVEAFFAGQIAPMATPNTLQMVQAPLAEMVSEAGLEPATVSLEG